MSGRRQRHLRKRPVDDGSEDETVIQKKPKQTARKETTNATTKESAGSVFAVTTDKTVQYESDQGATRQLETETEYDRDARCEICSMQDFIVGLQVSKGEAIEGGHLHRQQDLQRTEWICGLYKSRISRECGQR